MSEGHGVMRTTRHLSHFLALQAGGDLHRGQPQISRGSPHLAVAVVTPSKEQPVCNHVNKIVSDQRG